MRLGLEGVKRILNNLGDPQTSFPSVLVAGSNGKGSTAVIIASILKAAGYRTGLYTSPHLIDFRERIRVDGKSITETEVESLMGVIGDTVEEEGSSFFEATTAMALKHFSDKKVDIAVLEVGLGGRLDATNASHPALSVITSISKDHTEILGDSLDTITREKAGILRPGGLAVAGFEGGVAAEALRREAQAIGATVSSVGADVASRVLSVSRQGTSFSLRWKGDWEWGPAMMLGVPGRHQARNAATAALAAMSLKGAGFAVSVDHVAKGVKHVRWPGRFQVLGPDVSTCVLDVAHNPSAAEALVRTFQDVYPGGSAVLVLGMSADKDHRLFLRKLRPVVAEAVVTEAPNVRSLPVGILCRMAEEAGLKARVVPQVREAVSAARAVARARGAHVLVTGSIFVIGEAMVQLGVEGLDKAY